MYINVFCLMSASLKKMLSIVQKLLRFMSKYIAKSPDAGQIEVLLNFDNVVLRNIVLLSPEKNCACSTQTCFEPLKVSSSCCT